MGNISFIAPSARALLNTENIWQHLAGSHLLPSANREDRNSVFSFQTLTKQEIGAEPSIQRALACRRAAGARSRDLNHKILSSVTEKRTLRPDAAQGQLRADPVCNSVQSPPWPSFVVVIAGYSKSRPIGSPKLEIGTKPFSDTQTSWTSTVTEGQVRFFQSEASVANGADSNFPCDFRLISWPAE